LFAFWGLNVKGRQFFKKEFCRNERSRDDIFTVANARIFYKRLVNWDEILETVKVDIGRLVLDGLQEHPSAIDLINILKMSTTKI